MSTEHDVCLMRFVLGYADARRNVKKRIPRPFSRQDLVRAATQFAALNHISLSIEKSIDTLIDRKHLNQNLAKELVITTAGEVALLKYKKGAAH